MIFNKTFILILFFHCYAAYGAWVTNANDAGYLGDGLMGYIKAKYMAHKYHVSFVLTPFEHSDKFVLYTRERHVSGGYSGRVKLFHENQVQVSGNILNDISYYCAMNNWTSETPYAYGCNHLDILGWYDIYTDPNFYNELKELIRLRDESNMISLPSNMITVAVHVRKPRQIVDGHLGSVQLFDTRLTADQAFPYKFPPDQYYIDQIRKLSELFNDKPMYVFIFTEYPKSSGIIDRYRQAVGKLNITFACRERESSTDLAADDMIAMTKFDCLIRSHSNFSQMSHFLGNHKIVIYPKHAFWNGGKLVVDQVGIIQRD